jgi:hypothetical protein
MVVLPSFPARYKSGNNSATRFGLQQLGSFIRGADNIFLGDSRFAFFHAQLGQLQVLELLETGLIETIFNAVDRAAVDSQDGGGGFGGFQDAWDSSANTGQAKHFAGPVAGHFSGGLIGDGTDIGGAGTGENQFGGSRTLTSIFISHNEFSVLRKLKV